MTGICAFTGKDRDNAESRVNIMLASMKRRGIIVETFGGKTEETGYVVIGICKSYESPSRNSQKSSGAFLALDGSFFGEDTPMDPRLFDTNSFGRLLGTPGAFALLAFDRERLIAARDSLGQKPLYWGVDEQRHFAFASLKIALKGAGITDPKPVLPGQVIEVSSRGLVVSTDNVLTKPKHLEISEGEALSQLERLFLEGVRRMVPAKSGLAFSGGLDSALVAAACKRVGLEPELITVGLGGQPELERAAKAAGSIGLHVNIKRLSEDQVVKSLSHVVRIVESDNPVTVGISVPFYFACQCAQEMGVGVIVAGQLSDELYGGYARFEELALEQGLDKVDLAMWGSVLAAAEGDFEPGDKVASSFGLELRCPFAYLPLVNSALQLPVYLRVKLTGTDVSRKHILRRLAEKWGLPAGIVNRPKKAFQYSSGVQKILAKEARRQGLKMRELLSSLLQAMQ